MVAPNHAPSRPQPDARDGSDDHTRSEAGLTLSPTLGGGCADNDTRPHPRWDLP